MAIADSQNPEPEHWFPPAIILGRFDADGNLLPRTPRLEGLSPDYLDNAFEGKEGTGKVIVIHTEIKIESDQTRE